MLCLGVAYKNDIDDYRESPAIRVIEELEKVGAEVEFYDPWVSEYRENGKTVKGLESISPEIVASYDLVLVTAGHTNVDYQMVIDNAQAVFDTKNVTKNCKVNENVEIL